jgi:hypothetical protein
MNLDRIGYALAVLAVVCVLSVFFFPAMHGPYSVVNGPVTALLAARAAAGLRIALTGLSVLGLWLSGVLILMSWATGLIAEFLAGSLSAGCNRVLRC